MTTKWVDLIFLIIVILVLIFIGIKFNNCINKFTDKLDKKFFGGKK